MATKRSLANCSPSDRGVMVRPMLLSVSKVSKTFGGVVAAADVSVNIQQGEVVAVVGPNGAGKTTFINLITGWLKPDEGKIVLAGKEIAGAKPRNVVRAGLSRSFQISQVFPSLTVAENLKLAVALSNDRPFGLFRSFHDCDLEEQAVSLARQFRLESELTRLAGELSQGTKKLLDIALAAARRPRLILLDEPTSGVSADEKLELMNLVVTSALESGATLLFVEHDMDIVRRFASRVLAFVGGKIVCDDIPERAFEHPFFREHTRPARRHEDAEAKAC
jgi:branched-chain amino acid transport system ATP-binding protein